MSKPKKQLNKRLIALLVAWILPGAPFLGGCYMVLQGATVNLAGIAVLLLLPLAFMLWIGHIIVSEETVFEKTVLTVLLLIAFFWIFMVSSMFVTVYTYIHRTEPELPASYTEARERFPALPEPEALEGFEKVTHYNYHLQQTVLFASDADTFIFYYEAGQYERQKAQLDARYTFRQEPFIACDIPCNASAQLGHYSFRLVDDAGAYRWEIDFPHKLIIVATNDRERAIAYTAFYDQDLDYVESLESFLMEYCGWKKIISLRQILTQTPWAVEP